MRLLEANIVRHYIAAFKIQRKEEKEIEKSRAVNVRGGTSVQGVTNRVANIRVRKCLERRGNCPGRECPKN